MSEEVQERFEDYLELEQYIQQLHLQRSAHPPAKLTPQQMSIYGMAMLFHSASPHVADPRPEFKQQLLQRLLKQAQAEDKRQKQLRSIYRNKQASQPEQISSPHPKSTNVEKTRDAGTGLASPPRRRLLAGGTLAAASLLGATAIGGAIEYSLESQSHTNAPDNSPLLRNVPVKWYLVTSVDQLGKEAIRFTADTLIGYVIRKTANSNGANSSPQEQIVAFSAACTHRGCIVQWQENTRQFICPCHNGTFDATGHPVYIQKDLLYLTALPLLDTKIENGNIYVKVPLPPAQESNWPT
jgi:Rieske Fe-S protein